MNRKQEILEELKNTYKPVEAGKRFFVKPFEPEDAMGVIKCCYSIYGDAYPIDSYYIPEKLIEENSNGQRYSLVAKTADGEIIGYAALYRSSAQFHDLYEAGQYIIQKEYRGSRAAYQLNNLLVEHSKVLGISGLYGETVTNHLVTQKFGDRAGTISTALEIDLMPAEAYENDERVNGRVSALFQFLIFKDNPHKIFIPKEYFNIVKDSVQTINLSREIELNRQGSLNLCNANVKTEYFDYAGVGRFHILEIGEDIFNLLNDFENEIVKRNFQIAQVYITVAEQNSQTIFAELKNLGYFYGGYLPRWVDKDAILLQKLTHETKFENINLYPKRAIEILEFIKMDYARINGRRK